MSRYRLIPSPAQEAVLRDHCGHARFTWNLAVEQHRHWHPGRTSAPGYLEQCRQLTAARAEHPWLADGSQMVQQQALRDFAQATAAFFDPENPAGRPSWRKAGRNEGFRVVAVKPGDVRRLSRHVGEVRVPKAGWVWAADLACLQNENLAAARNQVVQSPGAVVLELLSAARMNRSLRAWICCAGGGGWRASPSPENVSEPYDCLSAAASSNHSSTPTPDSQPPDHQPGAKIRDDRWDQLT
jgi:hypothetical protein